MPGLCSVKRVFLEISQNALENTCARVFFLIKLQVQAEACNFIKKETRAQVFSGEFCVISKSTFSYTTHPWLLLSAASTAESIFESVAKQFNDHKLSWDYCMVIGFDNTNANIAG